MNFIHMGKLFTLFMVISGIWFISYLTLFVKLPYFNILDLSVANNLHGLLRERRNKREMDLFWPELGGFRGTRFNDIDQIREFFRDRNLRWKIILRVGDINFEDLGWRDGGDYLRRMRCPVRNCYFTSNQSAVDVADALVISRFEEKERKFLTPKRKNQIWVAQILEPPHHVKLVASLLKGLINWTATYRRDSVFSVPYGIWMKLSSRSISEPSKRNFARGKTKKVAMFVSNCEDISGRLGYAMELNKTTSVDIYGKCGSLKCSRNRPRSECLFMIKKDYKFYLSFENSLCAEYITEKLHWNALRNNAIPIVMGARRQDYTVAAPPDSYVHVDDFQSPRHLGEYLNLLDSNDTLYNEYFRYKGSYRLKMFWDFAKYYWCQLCTRLHMMDYENFTYWYDDFDQWWNNVCSTKFDGNNTWKTWNGNEASTLSNPILKL